ncbi:Antiviral helicase ski2 [Thecaphora frezii]
MQQPSRFADVGSYNDAVDRLRTAAAVADEASSHPSSLPDRLAQRHDATDHLIAQFLAPTQHLSPTELAMHQSHWPRKPQTQNMLWAEPSICVTSLDFVRAGLEGRIIGYKEVTHPHQPLPDAKSSTSLVRKPATSTNFVRGKSAFVPFAPGGLEAEVLAEDPHDANQRIETEVQEMEDALRFGRGLRDHAPGLSRPFQDPSVDVHDDGDGEDGIEIGQVDAVTGMAPMPIYRPSQNAGTARSSSATMVAGGASTSAVREQDAELDELLPMERPHPLLQKRTAKADAKRDWAHVIDVNQSLTNFKELVPEMAHSFPFELDTFQKEAVYHLEQGDSVFVAAHTSAGKTVVAEYAIALAQKHMTRCIYTSPIKALSNQKYRDFKQTFGAQNVGILTGDVQINPEAPCLIMTTEILRSMLYRGADLIRDVEFVIFDEVHYVNDQERGVVWEEVIILCPQHINMILLSATVPNTKEFADWVGRTKKKDIYVISTPKRPVPLEHFLYAGREIFKIVDAQAQFLGNGLKEAGEALKRKQEKEREAAGLGPPVRGGRGGRGGASGSNSRGGARGAMTPARGAAPASRGRGGAVSSGHRGSDKNLWIHLVGLLRKKDLLPCVVFVFSKKRCEEYASSMPNTDLCNAREKNEVFIVIEKSLTRLKGSDKNLPQIKRMRDLLGRGIGVHHGGLLPIVKEIVEILFQRGLVKVLFATETFAMGVNMPARSVVFSGIRKHDGHGFRDLLAGEYTQMSGRAGRRGLDATGVVIINAAEALPESSTLHKMLLGQATKLQSQFRLTYNMILNLLRVETLKVEEMIKRSFSENAAQKMLPDQQRKAEEVERKLSKLPRVQTSEMAQELSLYYDLSRSIISSLQGMYELALDNPQGSKNFAAGRVVLLRDSHFDHHVATIVRQVASREFLVLAAVSKEVKRGDSDSTHPVAPLWPPRVKREEPDNTVYDLREVPLSSVVFVCAQTIRIDVPLIMAHRISAMNRAVEALVPLRDSYAALDAFAVPAEVDWSKIRRLDFQEAVRARESYINRLKPHVSCLQSDSFAHDYELVHARKELEAELSQLLLKQSNQNLELLPDYQQRIEVLKTLRFIEPTSESVLLKGRVACEINSANELILTELILDNALIKYTPEETVALLSIFLFQEKTEMVPELAPRLAEGYAAIVEIADRVNSVQVANQLNFEDFSNTQKLGLVEVVYEWAKGTVCCLTSPSRSVSLSWINRR